MKADICCSCEECRFRTTCLRLGYVPHPESTEGNDYSAGFVCLAVVEVTFWWTGD